MATRVNKEIDSHWIIGRLSCSRPRRIRPRKDKSVRPAYDALRDSPLLHITEHSEAIRLRSLEPRRILAVNRAFFRKKRNNCALRADQTPIGLASATSSRLPFTHPHGSATPRPGKVRRQRRPIRRLLVGRAVLVSDNRHVSSV
jgi:hypothetical protein